MLFRMYIWLSVMSQWLLEIRSQLQYHIIVIFTQKYINQKSVSELCINIFIFTVYIINLIFINQWKSAITISDAKISPQCQRLIRKPEMYLCTRIKCIGGFCVFKMLFVQEWLTMLNKYYLFMYDKVILFIPSG